MNNATDCGCEPARGCSPAAVQLAIASVPIQQWETPYDPGQALRRGTIFPSLDKPFFAAGGDFLGR